MYGENQKIDAENVWGISGSGKKRKLLFPSLEIIAFHSSGVTKSFPPYLTLG